MEQTQFIVRIGVAFTAEGYEEAGEILDAIDRKVGKVIGDRGHHDITGFETQPCKAIAFADRASRHANPGVTARMIEPDRGDVDEHRGGMSPMEAGIRDVDRSEASIPCEESLDAVQAMILTPKLDPDAHHPDVAHGAVLAAITAAHQVLLDAGIENPVEILIVQTHDETGRTTGRTLASSAANPQDILRVVMRNVERHSKATGR